MLKKRLLLYLILFNILISDTSGANTETDISELNDEMLININNSVSNKKNYNILERLLKKRNKELKDLYLQSDFIIKPEYLEWQFFTIGFYNEDSRTGSLGSKNNENKKTLMNTNNEYKEVKLGPSIPYRNLTMQDINPDITLPSIESAISINLNKNPLEIKYPQPPELPEIKLNTVNSIDINDILINKTVQVNLLSVTVKTKTFNSVSIPSPILGANANGYDQRSDNTNRYTNLEVLPVTVLPSGYQKNGANVTGLIQIIGVKNSSMTTPNPAHVPGDLTYTLTQDLSTENQGSRIIVVEPHRGDPAVPLTPATGDPNDALFVTTTGTITMNSDNILGIELEQGYNFNAVVRNDSVYINRGIIQSDKANVIGVDYKGSSRGPLYVENQGSINLSGSTSIAMKTSNGSGINIGMVNQKNARINLDGNSNVGMAAVTGNFQPLNVATQNMPNGSYSTGFKQTGAINIKGTNNFGIIVRNNGSSFGSITSLNDTSGSISINGTGENTAIYLEHGGSSFFNNGVIYILSGANNTAVRVDSGKLENSTMGNITISNSSEDSTGIAVLNSNSQGINSGFIIISATGGNNTGLYGAGGTGKSLENKGIIHIEVPDTSSGGNIGVRIAGAGSQFENTGKITIINKDFIGRNIGIYSEDAEINHTAPGTIKLNTKGNNTGIYLNGNSTGIISGDMEIISSGTDYDYGIYFDDGYTGSVVFNSKINLQGKSTGIFSSEKGIKFDGIVNMTSSLSSDSIGLLYEISASSPAGNILENNGTINAVSGSGMYIYNSETAAGRTVQNNAGKTINVSEGGVGIVGESATYIPKDTLEIINSGNIINSSNSTTNSIGIYAKNQDMKITGTGKLTVESPGAENLGIYINGGEVSFESNIELSGKGIGAYLDGNTTNLNNSILNIGNTITALSNSTGIIAKGEKAAVNILSSGITLLGQSAENVGSTAVFLENANINNAGLIKTGDFGTTAYLKSTAEERTVNLGSLETGNNGVGIYLENENSLDSITSIKTGTNSVAVYNKDGSIDIDTFNSANFDLGAGSTMYFIENSILKSLGIMSDINAGNDVTGVILTGNSSIDSSIKNIIIGNNTLNSVNPVVLGIKGIGTSPVITTKLTGGDGTVGIYYEEDGTGNTVTYNGAGNNTVPDIKTGVSGGLMSSVGVYLKAETSGVEGININNAYIQINGSSGIALGADTGMINMTGGKIEITEGGVLFLMQSGGHVNVSPSTTIITPDKNVEFFRVIYENHTSDLTLEIPEKSVGIHGETGIIINEGNLVSKIINGEKAKSSIGIYIENTEESAPNVLKYPVAAAQKGSASQGINKNNISLGDEGIGIFGENSTVRNDAAGTIDIGSNGVGLYVTIGSVAENHGVINVGKNSIGIYALDREGSPDYTGETKVNYSLNSKQINSISDGVIGISSTGADPDKKSQISNIGTISLTGSNETGIYGNQANITNFGNIFVGNGTENNGTVNYSSGIMSENGNVNMQNGQISGGNYSIGTAVVGNSTINIKGGTITVGENSVFNYLKRSNGTAVALNDTSGGTYDLNKINQIGIYSEEGNVTSNKTLEIRSGTGAMGVYSQNNGNVDMQIQGLTINTESGEASIFSKGISGSGVKTTLNNNINLNGDSSQGIVIQDGDVKNTGTINTEGNSAVGILTINSDNKNINNIENTGTINVNADLGIGIYGTTTNGAEQNIINSGDINLAAVSSQDNIILGIYGEQGTNISNTGDISAGKNTIGIYGEGINVKQNSGTLSIDKNGIGIYLNSGTGQMNNTVINIADGDGAGVYMSNFASIDIGNSNVINAGDTTGSLSGNAAGSYGIVSSNSTVTNNGIINTGLTSIGIYLEDSVLNNTGNITAVGGGDSLTDGRILIYASKTSETGTGNSITNSGILDAGDMGIGVYMNSGTLENSGEIITGDSYLEPSNPLNSKFAVGIYGVGTIGVTNINKIIFGKNALGMYLYTPLGPSINSGTLTSSADNGVGVYIESGNKGLAEKQEFVNTGSIILSGKNSIGISGVDHIKIINKNLIEVTGDNSTGIYAGNNSEVVNDGVVRATGANGIGIMLKGNSTLINTGIIDVDTSANGRAIVTDRAGSTKKLNGYTETVDVDAKSPLPFVGSGETYKKPSIVNAGIIKVSERFEVPEDAIIKVKVDPDSVMPASMVTEVYAPEDINGKYLISNAVQFVAKEFVLRNIKVTTDFSQGTNLLTYKLEDVFVLSTPGGGINYGETAIKSEGLMWDAIPIINSTGNLDIWMTKRSFSDFSEGSSWDSFAGILDKNYEDAEGNQLKLYDKLDGIENEAELRNIMSDLSGSFYANRAQRDYDIKRGFDNALNIVQNSENNTKENIKVALFGGAGKTNENKDGVLDYKYKTAGIYALREVEKSYTQKFGYSLGYARNSFDIQDGNNSKEEVDTVQLGLHNKYSKNSWKMENNLTGRINSHNVDRNTDWGDSTENIDNRYMSYGASLENTLLKEFELGKVFKISPLVSFDLGYQYLGKVDEESELAALEIDSNNAYSIKPGVGIRFEGVSNPRKEKGWRIKTGMEVKYGYELGDSQPEETAKMKLFNESYKLAQPTEDKGAITVKALLGIERADRYGIYLTGEYGNSFNDSDDGQNYKAGVVLKAVF